MILDKIGVGIQRLPEHTLDTAVVRLKVGGGRVGVETLQHCTICMTAPNSHSFQHLSRGCEGELFTHFHTLTDKPCSPYCSICIKTEVLMPTQTQDGHPKLIELCTQACFKVGWHQLLPASYQIW